MKGRCYFCPLTPMSQADSIICLRSQSPEPWPETANYALYPHFMTSNPFSITNDSRSQLSQAIFISFIKNNFLVQLFWSAFLSEKVKSRKLNFCLSRSSRLRQSQLSPFKPSQLTYACLKTLYFSWVVWDKRDNRGKIAALLWLKLSQDKTLKPRDLRQKPFSTFPQMNPTQQTPSSSSTKKHIYWHQRPIHNSPTPNVHRKIASTHSFHKSQHHWLPHCEA